MRRSIGHGLMLVGCLATPGPFARADVTLPQIIAENMVLQQGDDVPVWGWAGAGETVSVGFQGRRYKARPRDGRWEVRMSGLKAGGPYTLRIEGKNAIEFKNVLVGEVWLCSGQSNMQMRLNETQEWKTAAAWATNPRIRLFVIPLRTAQEPQKDIQDTVWKECDPQTASEFSAVGYYFGKALAKERGVPIGLIRSAYGGTPAVAWTPRRYLEADPAIHVWLDDLTLATASYEKALAAQRRTESRKPAGAVRLQRGPSTGKKSKAAAQRREEELHDPRLLPNAPSVLFNAMIAPIVPFAIRGVIWYQGEGDTIFPERYPAIFRTMIAAWRREWGRGAFPFLYVQLAAFADTHRVTGGTPHGIDVDWPVLREAQLEASRRVKNAGMVSAIDLGDAADIHPKQKKEVGERLALAALNLAYGRDVEFSGPVFRKMKVKEGKAELQFDHADGGLKARGGPLRGFEICGADGKSWPATAGIEGKKVVASSPEVKRPVAVRYAWAGFPEANLYNNRDLPASPFRMDGEE